MSKRERVRAALKGEPVDRAPVAFWRHWPGDDQYPEFLAAAALDFQRTYDLDFIKLPVTPAYTVNDYGSKHEYQGSLIGDRVFLEFPVHYIADWDRIEPIDIHRGTYGWHLDALYQVIQQKEKETPVLVTMFNPLSIAAYLAGDEVLLSHLRQSPERVKPAIEALTETCVKFSKAVIETGADGIFLSTRFASFDMMDDREYQQFGRPGDLEIFSSAGQGWFNVLHLHGKFPMLDQLSDYPAQALNWHDRTTEFDLMTASKLFPGALMGGVEQYQVLRFGKTDDVINQVKDAIRQMDNRRLIVTPGCTYHIDVPQANLRAMREAVEKNQDKS